MTEKELMKTFEQIIEINEIVGEYEIHLQNVPKGSPRLLRVKVLKLSNNAEFPYLGIANLEVKGKGCADFYRSIHPEKTKEMALHDAVRGFFAFLSDEAVVREVSEE
jgi:hypothetical protein